MDNSKKYVNAFYFALQTEYEEARLYFCEEKPGTIQNDEIVLDEESAVELVMTFSRLKAFSRSLASFIDSIENPDSENESQ